jgi:hypothetical protein
MKMDDQRANKIYSNRKKKKITFFGYNEIHAYRNKFCQIEIFLTIILCIYNVKIYIYIYI